MNIIVPNHVSSVPMLDPRLNYGNNLMWVATFRNGTIVSQYDIKGNARSFADLPRLNLKRLSLITIREGKLITSQDFIQGMSPFYRQRTMMSPGVGTTAKIHIIGWAIWDGKITVSNLHVAFVNEATFEVEMGHFVDGRHAGFKYPIELADYDYPPIVWN